MPREPFVLDASVTLAWFFPDERSPHAERVLEHLLGGAALVPAIWPLEITNILALAQRRGRAARGDVERFIGLVAGLVIQVDAAAATTTASFGPVLHLANMHRLTAYDSAYLELAARTSLPLASLDKRLLAAAQRAGIAPLVLHPPK